MAFRNSQWGYGWFSRLLHWIMAILILGMLGFGTWLKGMTPSVETVWLFGLHKSVGLTLLALAIVRLIWHVFSPPPGILSDGIPAWQLAVAIWVRRGLYLLMLLVPLAGWIGSAATGIDVTYFGLVRLPPIVPPSEAIDKAGFFAHGVLTKALMALVGLHIAGALHRHFVIRDATLRRMLRGT